MKRFTVLTIFIILLVLLTGALFVEAQGKPEGVATHIIVFHSDVNTRAAANQMAVAHGLQVTNVYRHALNGMAAVVPEGRLRALSRDPRVAYVEENMEVSIDVYEEVTGVNRIYAPDNVNLDIDDVDDFRVDVDVAVLDTGIDYEHPDLNVQSGVDCTGGGPFTKDCSPGGDDDHFHGTHVAGTIGALDNGIGVVGVAPGARLWPVKVLTKRGSGYTNWIIAGIEWVVAQGNIEVINMSLGGSGISTAYKDAIDAAVESGVVVVVSAGNDSTNAANYSPAYVPNAITVSALADFNGASGGGAASTCRDDQDDTFADFSNYGSVVDIIAPGICITSTYPLEQGGYGTISGTSMAAPHVAGAAALLASGANSPQDALDVAFIRYYLVNNGNTVWDNTDDPDGIQERLLDVSNTSVFMPTLVLGSEVGGANNPPTAAFAYTCTDLSCTFDASGSTDSDGTISSYVWDFGDGNSTTGEIVNYTFTASGVYTVTLTVTDDDDASDNDSQSIAVSNGINNPPTASFHSYCTDMTCDFNGVSSKDSDGAIIYYDWDFGDGAGASGVGAVNPTHIYSIAGTYTVILTVTDNGDATDSVSQDVTVTLPGYMFVGDLDGSVNNSKGNWSAIVTITVLNDNGAAVSGATVSGNFSTGNNESCTTGVNGTCSVESSSVRKRDYGSIMFTVTDVDGSLAYKSNQNNDPDGDSDGTSITVNR